MIKKIYQTMLPLKLRCWMSQRFRQPLLLIAYYRYDRKRFQNYCAASGAWDRENRLARITALYHVLEKGLSFRDSRPMFGKDKVLQLIADLTDFSKLERYETEVQWQSAVRVLDVYLKRHEELVSIDKEAPLLGKIRDALAGFQYERSNVIQVGGGYIKCNRSDIQERAKGGFPEMALSRYSVRHFSGERVPNDVIEQAVQWAQKSPSVCNRQSARIHAIQDRKLIDKILDLHGGTRGFTEQIDTLLIVTGDLRIFLGPTERNQIYLDTGIFSMSLLYGLHYLGVGGCPLHWCVDPAKDIALRDLARIPEEETIATLIAVGSLPDEYKVAHSQRRLTEDVLSWVQPI